MSHFKIQELRSTIKQSFKLCKNICIISNDVKCYTSMSMYTVFKPFFGRKVVVLKMETVS